MSDDFQDLEPIDLSGAGPAAPGPGPGSWLPGWYADPWTAGQYRYWSGQTWTGETNRWGPATTPPAQTTVTAIAPWPATASPAAPSPFEVGAPDGGTPSRGPMVAGVIALVVLLLVSGAVGFAINSHSHSKRAAVLVPGPITPSPSPSPTTAPSSQPPVSKSTDPDSGVLGDLVVQQTDVAASRTVLLIPNGNVTTQPTLDLCNGTFASESLRTARLQVADVDANGNASLSTEAVLYRNAAASTEAFAELRQVSAACPDSPVVSPVHEQTATTVFKAAPDGSWPRTPSVERQAYSIVSSVAATATAPATSSPSIAVYLRRGRVLLGLYFPIPSGTQPAVDGQTTIEGIVGVFEARMAKLPASVVNGTS